MPGRGGSAVLVVDEYALVVERGAQEALIQVQLAPLGCDHGIVGVAGDVERVALQAYLGGDVVRLGGLHALVDQREADLDALFARADPLQVAQRGEAHQVETGLSHVMNILLQLAHAVILGPDRELLGVVGGVVGQAQAQLRLAVPVQYAVFDLVHLHRLT